MDVYASFMPLLILASGLLGRGGMYIGSKGELRYKLGISTTEVVGN